MFETVRKKLKYITQNNDYNPLNIAWLVNTLEETNNYAEVVKEELDRFRTKVIPEIQEDSAFVDKKMECYEKALREIDTHIRSDKNPIPYIIESLKKTLPEYKEQAEKLPKK